MTNEQIAAINEIVDRMRAVFTVDEDEYCREDPDEEPTVKE